MPKKIPMRQCLGCREMKPNGRGAYLCPDPACLKKAIKAKALEHAFSAPIPPEVYERLHEEMEAGE